MCITLDLEEEVLLAIREIARRRGVTMGQVLSDLVRQALAGEVAGTVRNGVPLFPVQPGAGVVTMELVSQLRDEAVGATEAVTTNQDPAEDSSRR